VIWGAVLCTIMDDGKWKMAAFSAYGGITGSPG